MPLNDKDRVKSLEKALNLLITLSRHKEGAPLEGLTKETGLTKTTCFRLLATMKEMNFVEQDPDNSLYRLGPRNISVGAAALHNLSLRKISRPYMHKLQDITQETVNLSILDGTDIVFVERLEAGHILSTRHSIGDRLPVHCTCMGKVLLAFSPPAKVDRVMAQISFQARTDKTIANLEQWQKELSQVREQGMAVNDEELEKGLCAVAAPLRNYSGEAVAALNIAFPLIRHTKDEALELFVPLLKEMCGEISLKLGFSGKDTPPQDSGPEEHP